jgi:hypothetical protein
MPGKILLSTAYFPPTEYFSLIRDADEIFIEHEESYVKQSYRNRCMILTSGGLMVLSVPVMKGGPGNIPVRDIRIDYSKRWQQVHIRALTSAYSRSPYFQFYSKNIEEAILKNRSFLLDLNYELLSLCLNMLRMNRGISYTTCFEPVGKSRYDFRYIISPKIRSEYKVKPYFQVFGGSVPEHDLSILDLVFNTGPEAADYL